MTAANSGWFPLFLMSLIVAFHTWYLVRHLWTEPLKHGPGYFLGISVPAGFYEGPGVQWIRRYHGILLLQYSLVLTAFLFLVISGDWSRLPLLVPVQVGSMFGLIGGFTLLARRRLNKNPPVLERVAIDLRPRRLADYISWPIEGLLLAILTLTWLLGLVRPPFEWDFRAGMTFIVLGLLPGKILIVRHRLPLPTEHRGEHERFEEGGRRQALRYLESMRWMAASILAVVAVFRAFPAWKELPWVWWPGMGIPFAVWIVMLAIVIRGTGQLKAMSAGLRPMGSWKSPFLQQSRAYLAWLILFCLGLVALTVFFR